MKVFMCEQRSREWWSLRRGVPTASQFSRIMTPAKRQYAAAAKTYIRELYVELLPDNIPRSGSGFVNKSMQHGIDTEPEARAWYEFRNNIDVQQVGFCKTDCGRFGCSPDGLVGADGGIEIKCPGGETHLEYQDEGGLPLAHACQVHGFLIVTGRAWCDFVSYIPGLPDEQQICVRVVPNDFTADLRGHLETFAAEYAKYTAAKANSPKGVDRE